MDRLSKGYKQAIDQIWGRMVKYKFFVRTKKYPFHYQSLANLEWFQKRKKRKKDFWTKKSFSAKHKNGRFPVILAGTRSVVIVAHFFWWPRQSHQVSLTTKIKGTHSSDSANGQKLGEPRKMIQISETFFRGWFQWVSCSPGYTGDMPCWQKSRYQNKNWLLAQNIQILGWKLHIFVPVSQLEPHRSMFSTLKRCLIGSLIWGYQKFYSFLPKNMDF